MKKLISSNNVPIPDDLVEEFVGLGSATPTTARSSLSDSKKSYVGIGSGSRDSRDEFSDMEPGIFLNLFIMFLSYARAFR
jgi:hypothetical protein